MGQYSQFFGCLLKVENLWCLEEYGIKNTCILESLKAYPGYYGNAPSSDKPLNVYIVSDTFYSMEEVVRISEKVKKIYDIEFSAAYSHISISPDTCVAVRIAGAKNYSEIRRIQEAYKNCGFNLKRKVRGIEDAEAIIKIYKFFLLEEINNNIYLDKANSDIGYFKIKDYLDWNEFVYRIQMLRNNVNTQMFDAAISFIYKDGVIIDMIRIYSKNITVELLDELSTRYYSLF